jgi:hypothetical protein
MELRQYDEAAELLQAVRYLGALCRGLKLRSRWHCMLVALCMPYQHSSAAAGVLLGHLVAQAGAVPAAEHFPSPSLFLSHHTVHCLRRLQMVRTRVRVPPLPALTPLACRRCVTPCCRPASIMRSG